MPTDNAEQLRRDLITLGMMNLIDASRRDTIRRAVDWYEDRIHVLQGFLDFVAGIQVEAEPNGAYLVERARQAQAELDRLRMLAESPV